MRAIKAEFRKLRRSKAPMWTLIALFATIVALLAGSYWSSTESGSRNYEEMSPNHKAAVEAGILADTYECLMNANPGEISGEWGVMMFAFITAYVFGRERTEGTESILLTAPVRRRWFVVGKMAVIAVWVFGLALVMFVIQAPMLAMIAEEFSWPVMWHSFSDTLQATLLLYLTLPLVAYVTLTGRPGYLRPMLVFSGVWILAFVLSLSEHGYLFPWTMPMLLGGTAAIPMPASELTGVSWAISIGVFAVGLVLTMHKLERGSDAR